MLGDTLYLDNIEEYVQDENKIVTYKWLSRNLEVPVNSAKQMLYSYVTRCRTNSENEDSSVTVTYLVTGRVNNGGCKEHQVLLVDENDLEDTKRQFTQLLGTHIYSVQKKKLKESCSLYAADYDISREHVQDYSRWSTIDCLSTVVRSMAIKKEKIDQSDKGSAKAVSSEKHSSPPKLSHMEKDTSGNHAKPSLMSGKHKPSWKTSAKSKPAPKGSVMSFFNRQTENGNKKKTEVKGKLEEKDQLQVKEEKPPDDVIADKEPQAPANPSMSPKRSPKKSPKKSPSKQSKPPKSAKDDQPHQDTISSMFSGLNESDIDDGDTVSEDEQPTKKQPKTRQPAKSKKRSKNTKQEKLKVPAVEGDQQRKRRRIQELPSDEEFSDNEKTFSKKDEKCEDDHIKVGGSGTKRRKRVKKLVSKMYMNDDDEMVTEKSWEVVSTDASDEEQESSMERKKFKGEDSSKSSDVQVKSEKQTPLKQNIAKKQSSLMSFFKK